MNDNGDAVSQILEYLNIDYVKHMALNVDFMTSVVGLLDPAIIAGASNANAAFLTSLISAIPANVGTAAAEGLNHNAAFINAMVAGSDPVVLAGVVNQSTTFLHRHTGSIARGNGPSGGCRPQRQPRFPQRPR